ncbi:hypothetical protein V1506DRAFT_66087 [Lipomyces tetrasporus]
MSSRSISPYFEGPYATCVGYIACIGPAIVRARFWSQQLKDISKSRENFMSPLSIHRNIEPMRRCCRCRASAQQKERFLPPCRHDIIPGRPIVLDHPCWRIDLPRGMVDLCNDWCRRAPSMIRQETYRAKDIRAKVEGKHNKNLLIIVFVPVLIITACCDCSCCLVFLLMQLDCASVTFQSGSRTSTLQSLG